MRFGMYLPLWGINNRTKELLWTTHDINYRVTGRNGHEREFKDENKTAALKQATRLSASDRSVIRALHDRQSALAQLFAARDQLQTFDARATAPFTTGLGNEHPLESGFSFLNPYGLPYLPGSGVKGVLRQAARELASGEWGDPRRWSDDRRHPLRVDGKPVLDSNEQPVMLSMLDLLFGRETPAGESDHLRGALCFWDVIPQIEGDSLMVEIMTPHQSHYYQNGASPHESGSPNPINFLTVPPGSHFVFHVQCDLALLTQHAPELAKDGLWKQLLAAAFDHAFRWLGFGAKTAVGYGAMQDANALATEPSKGTTGTVSATGRPEGPVVPDVAWPKAQLRFNARNGALTAIGPGGAEAHALNPKGLQLLAGLPTELQRKVKQGQFVRVSATVRGAALAAIQAAS